LDIRFSNILIAVLISGTALFIGCNQMSDTSEPYIARYKEKKLYKSDLNFQIGDIIGHDSSEYIRSFAEQWLKEQILLELADNNLANEQKDITKEVEHYKNTLIIYRYYQEYISQHLDTTFSHKELEEYFNSNFEEYFLEESIVRALFIQMPRSAPRSDFVERFYQSEKPKDIEKLDQFCNKNAFKYDDFKDKWVTFSKIQEFLPEVIPDHEIFLRTNRFLEMSDSNFFYFLKIKDYKLKGSHAPLEFATEMIKPSLINKRKNEIIKMLEVNSFKDAVQNKEAEINLK